MGMGTRAKRTKRIMATSLGDFIRECEEHESGREDFRRNWSGGFGYRNDVNEWGQPSGVQYVTTPLGTHRDASPAQESNWDVIRPAMEKADSFAHISEHEGNMVHTEGSCLNGWNDSIVVRVDDAVSVKAAMEFVNALADYPYLDEDDVSRREWEANHPDGYNCYAEEGCSCADGEHTRMNEASEEGEYDGCRAWLAGELENQDKPGWSTFEGNDVTEEHEETEDPEYIAHVTADSRPGKYLDSRDTYTIYDDEHGWLVSWQWYCGADGCGHWIDATQADLRLIRRHRLFSDLPPAPTVSLVKEAQGRLF